MSMTRRQFVATLTAAAPLVAASTRAIAATTPPRALNFLHLHTGERLSIEYFAGGRYLSDALTSVNHFLRDFRTGEIHAIDPGLLDLLDRLTRTTSTSRPFQVISGYRSPATNEMLRQHSEGVAVNSLHMKGQAIDIRLADVPLGALRSAALALRGGGVGFYPSSNFVHVDTGRVRSW
jgi:uncharacterized protein YcbK (DUF882 family)